MENKVSLHYIRLTDPVICVAMLKKGKINNKKHITKQYNHKAIIAQSFVDIKNESINSFTRGRLHDDATPRLALNKIACEHCRIE